MAQLASPRVIVIVEIAGSDDGTEYTVQTDNRDAVQWDLVRGRKNWPAGTDAPMLWMTFLAWHALIRTGVITTKLEDFMGICISVRPADKKGEPTPVDPTPPAVAAGS